MKDSSKERNQPPGEKAMTIRDVAEYLHCHISSVYRYVKSGEIPAFRLGGGWRFMRADLERWIRRKSSLE